MSILEGLLRIKIYLGNMGDWGNFPNFRAQYSQRFFRMYNISFHFSSFFTVDRRINSYAT